MAQGSNAVRIGIQLVLAVVIAVGAYLLYRTITDPWAEYEAEQLETQLTRARMDHIRTALIDFRDDTNRYPGSLDTLVTYVKTDSVYAGEDLAEVFPVPGQGAFTPDSLPFSPRSGRPFIYDIVRDDTSGVEIYYLQDPDKPEDPRRPSRSSRR